MGFYKIKKLKTDIIAVAPITIRVYKNETFISMVIQNVRIFNTGWFALTSFFRNEFFIDSCGTGSAFDFLAEKR